MANEEKSNKLITIILALVIIIAGITIVYLNLIEGENEDTEVKGDEGSDDDKSDDDTTADDTIDMPIVSLNIIYDDQELTYNFEDIANMDTTTGTARKLKANPFFKDGTIIINPNISEAAYQFSGVKLSLLIGDIEDLPEKYNATLYAPDDYNATFNETEIQGNIITYNETGNEVYVNAELILAYQEKGEYITGEDGPLQAVIVGDEPISLSSLWVKNVVLIEITD